MDKSKDWRLGQGAKRRLEDCAKSKAARSARGNPKGDPPPCAGALISPKQDRRVFGKVSLAALKVTDCKGMGLAAERAFQKPWQSVMAWAEAGGDGEKLLGWKGGGWEGNYREQEAKLKKRPMSGLNTGRVNR